MKKIFKQFIILNLLLGQFALGIANGDESCRAPAKSILPQILDLCLLLNSTDDELNPGVMDCKQKYNNRENTCQNRIEIKEIRCKHLISEKLDIVKSINLDQCITSLKTEGYLTLGCELPIDEECIKKTKLMLQP